MSDLRPPRYLKPMNRIVKAIQKLGIPAGPSQILTVPGRKSGKLRSTPMTPFKHDGGLYTVAGYPGADWAANARAAGAGTLTRGRKSRPVKIIELSAEDAGTGAAQLRCRSAGRGRLREAVGPGARRHAGRIRGARRRARRVPVRPATVRPPHGPVARCTTTSPEPVRACTTSVSSPSAGPSDGCRLLRTEPDRCADPVAPQCLPRCRRRLHRWRSARRCPAVDGGGDGDVARRGLRVEVAPSRSDRQRTAGGPELDVAVELAERDVAGRRRHRCRVHCDAQP